MVRKAKWNEEESLWAAAGLCVPWMNGGCQQGGCSRGRSCRYRHLTMSNLANLEDCDFYQTSVMRKIDERRKVMESSADEKANGGNSQKIDEDKIPSGSNTLSFQASNNQISLRATRSVKGRDVFLGTAEIDRLVKLNCNASVPIQSISIMTSSDMSTENFVDLISCISPFGSRGLTQLSFLCVPFTKIIMRTFAEKLPFIEKLTIFADASLDEHSEDPFMPLMSHPSLKQISLDKGIYEDKLIVDGLENLSSCSQSRIKIEWIGGVEDSDDEW